jgi:glutathione S-transferase
MLKLFYAPGACSLASHIALEEAGAAYEGVRLDLKAGDQNKPEYRQINPKARVPALATERGTLSESTAILSYIAQSFPQARLAPADDPFAFARMQSFNSFLSSTVHIAFAHVFRPSRYADGEGAAAAMKAKAPQALDEAFGVVEAQLSSEWAMGADYTVTDPYLYVFSRWFHANRLGHPDDFPKTAAHLRRVQDRPAVRRALEQEGLPPI